MAFCCRTFFPFCFGRGKTQQLEERHKKFSCNRKSEHRTKERKIIEKKREEPDNVQFQLLSGNHLFGATTTSIHSVFDRNELFVVDWFFKTKKNIHSLFEVQTNT